jgi:hypothetical protein
MFLSCLRHQVQSSMGWPLKQSYSQSLDQWILLNVITLFIIQRDKQFSPTSSHFLFLFSSNSWHPALRHTIFLLSYRSFTSCIIQLLVDISGLNPRRKWKLLFLVVTQPTLLVVYRRFGTAYFSHIQGSNSSSWTAWPLKMFRNVGKELPTYVAQQPIRSKTSSDSVLSETDKE